MNVRAAITSWNGGLPYASVVVQPLRSGLAARIWRSWKQAADTGFCDTPPRAPRNVRYSRGRAVPHVRVAPRDPIVLYSR